MHCPANKWFVVRKLLASGDMIVDNVLARSADSACALISEQTGLDQSELYATVIPD